MVSTAAMGATLEEIENVVWDEAAAHRQHVAIAVAMLMAAEDAQWLYQVKVLSGARHRDVQEAALFLDLLGAAGRQVRRDAAVGDVEHKHRIPFLALRGMDRRQHKVVFVEMRRARLGAGSLGRIQGQLGQEGASCRIGSRDLLQLIEISRPRRDIVRAGARDAADTTGGPERSLPPRASLRCAARKAPRRAPTNAVRRTMVPGRR